MGKHLYLSALIEFIMDIRFNEIEALLPGYFTGELSDEDSRKVNGWRSASADNELLFLESMKAWEAIPLLHEMEQFNSFEALKKINARITSTERRIWWNYFQKIAAVLIFPLLIYSVYTLIRGDSLEEHLRENILMQTISSRQGMVTQVELADGSMVWLNSGSVLQVPTLFNGDLREVELRGEAFFEVKKNEKQPFRVLTKGINIKVLGTSFNVVSYDDEQRSEVVLVEGKVELSSEKNGRMEKQGVLRPGQRAVYREDIQKVELEDVAVDKYIAWREGNLIFQDDKMEEVVKRLSRWFNVDIIINDPEIKNYIYKATFRNESLTQVLNLLKISAPIDYTIEGNKLLSDGEYSKQKVYLMKKKK